jgi:hypothetical protein
MRWGRAATAGVQAARTLKSEQIHRWIRFLSLKPFFNTLRMRSVHYPSPSSVAIVAVDDIKLR